VQPGSIDEVIDILGQIVAECRQERSKLGYFPALYRKTTIQVKRGIEQGRFEDGARMERLDIAFANRYIKAYQQFRQGLDPSHAWAYTFRMAQEHHPIILQHLLLGMNAHINLDLGVAAAESCSTTSLHTLRRDFFEISDILEEMIDWVQDEVGQLSPGLKLVDKWGQRLDEHLCNFAIRKARSEAWQSAELLSRLSPTQKRFSVTRRDLNVTVLARLICPSLPINPVLNRLRSLETVDPATVIDVLY